MKKCLQCSATVKHANKDGTTSGSVWMAVNDPNNLFCSMRCAARYGIAAAQKRDTRAKTR